MGHGMRQLTKSEAQHQKHHQHGALSPQRVHTIKPNAPPWALQLHSSHPGVHSRIRLLPRRRHFNTPCPATTGGTSRISGDWSRSRPTRLHSAAHPHQEMTMTHESMQTCIDACNECASACDHCASACLQEDQVQAMAHCIALDLDCAAICRTAAGFMSRSSEFAAVICEACAQICEACAEECVRHPMEHCQACAQACQRCAEECRRMVSQHTTARRTGTRAGAPLTQ